MFNAIKFLRSTDIVLILNIRLPVLNTSNTHMLGLVFLGPLVHFHKSISFFHITFF